MNMEDQDRNNVEEVSEEQNLIPSTDGEQDTSTPQEENIIDSGNEETVSTSEVQDGSEEQVKEQSNRNVPRVPLPEHQKERQRRREAERRNRELMEKLDQIENRVNTLGEPDLESEIADELGLDREAAAKLTKAIKKVTGKQAPKKQESDLDQNKARDFIMRANEASQDFDDWADVKDEMESVFEERFRRVGNKAFEVDPEDYYFQAKGRLGLSNAQARQAGKSEAIRKVNQKNLAVTESSRNSTGKPIPPTTWTRAKIQEAIDNGSYDKHRAEILDLYAKGKITE